MKVVTVKQSGECRFPSPGLWGDAPCKYPFSETTCTCVYLLFLLFLFNFILNQSFSFWYFFSCCCCFWACLSCQFKANFSMCEGSADDPKERRVGSHQQHKPLSEQRLWNSFSRSKSTFPSLRCVMRPSQSEQGAFQEFSSSPARWDKARRWRFSWDRGDSSGWGLGVVVCFREHGKKCGVLMGKVRWKQLFCGFWFSKKPLLSTVLVICPLAHLILPVWEVGYLSRFG